MNSEQVDKAFREWAASEDVAFGDGKSFRAGWEAARGVGMEEAANWFEKELFERKWNGVVGSGSAYAWLLRGDWRHVVSAWNESTLIGVIRARIGEQK